MPNIVTVNASVTVAAAPSTLQKTGAFVSQGGTVLTPGTYALLTSQSGLASYIASSAAITSLAWSGGVVTATTTAPHGFTIGDTLSLTIAGASPAGYNGTFLATITGASTFTYVLISNPGSETTPGMYIPDSANQLVQMNNTFWAQGSIVPVYVLELGPGNATDGVAALTAFIAANNNPQFFYSYLVPRYWDGNAAFLGLLAQFESPSSKTYFHITTTLQTYINYLNQNNPSEPSPLKDVLAYIEAPALGAWGSNIITELLAAPASPTLSSSAAGTLPATTYYVRVTYNTAYGETPASQEANEAVAADHVLVVDSPTSLSGATSWNVYVGTTSGSETLQEAGIALATNWTEPTSGLISGVAYPAKGFAVATTTTNHNVAVGQWFQLAGFTPTGYNGWYQALGGTSTDTLVMFVQSDLAPESALGLLVASFATQTAAPGGVTGEFTAAAGFYKSLSYAPSSANLMTPFAFSFLFGVTAWATQGNSAILTTLKAANVNIVLTGAEGGISNDILEWGTTMDGSDFMEWYSADWIQINLVLNLANAVINGSNDPINPLYYSQFGIETLQDVAVATATAGVSFGLGNGTVTQSALTGLQLAQAIAVGTFDGDINVNAVPFVPYLQGSPGDYAIGKYAGLSVLWIVNRGFTNIVVNLNISDFPVS